MRSKLDPGTVDLIRERIDAVRKTIKVKEIVDEMQKCALGEKIMDKEQIKCGEILLRKVLPDLKQIEHSGEVALRRAEELSDAELADIATGSGDGAAETPSRTE